MAMNQTLGMVEWNSPWRTKRNNFSVSIIIPGIASIECGPYNQHGGALGNVECFVKASNQSINSSGLGKATSMNSKTESIEANKSLVAFKADKCVYFLLVGLLLYCLC